MQDFGCIFIGGELVHQFTSSPGGKIKAGELVHPWGGFPKTASELVHPWGGFPKTDGELSSPWRPETGR